MSGLAYVKLLPETGDAWSDKMPYRIKSDGYVCMYGHKTFVTKFEQVSVYLQLAEVVRKQSGTEKSKKLFRLALDTEKKLSAMYA